MATIGDLFHVKAGGDFNSANSSLEQSEQFPFPVYANGLENRGLYGFTNCAQCEAGAITVTARGTLGVAFYRDTPFTAIGRLLVLQPKNELDGRFFAEYINIFVHFAVESTGVPQLTAPQISRYKLPLPPLPEQRAIAAALADVDGLLAALDDLLAKKRAVKTAAMQQLLTGKTRLPGFSGEWVTRRLGDLLVYERPDKYIVKDTDYRPQGQIPVLTANKSFILGYTDERFGICKNIPVIVFDDFTTDSKYVDFPFKVKSSAIKILRSRDNNRADLRFVYELMQIIRFPIGDHKRYYIAEYQHIRLPVPTIDEQRAIAAVLSDMDAEIAALEARREKVRQIKQGMMQVLLTGKVRLVTL